jgi:pimeloyl-ACP methyl ester carboxylesterase/putative sterol carrier protein
MFWTKEQVNDLKRALADMPEWHQAIKYCNSCIALADDQSQATILVDRGTAKLEEGTQLGQVEILVKGPTSDWARVKSGDLDWFRATTLGIGGLNVEGDQVYVMGKTRILWLIFKAIEKTGPGKTIDYSPPPPKRRAPSVGRYIEVDGIETYYEEAGSGHAILCLHAACQDTLQYRHVLAGLSDRYRVIAVDAPGHGKSLMPSTGPFRNLTQHAAFNEKLIDKLGLERPVIVGCSMGGNQVLELAARRPGNYAAVISTEGADYTPGLNDFVLDMFMINGQELLECYPQSLIGKRTPPDRAEEVLWQIRRTTPEIMRADLGGYSGFDKRDEMKKITDPVLLIRGNGDWLVTQQQVEATASRVKGAKIAILDGSGHYPMTENPTEFNAAVIAFLREIGVGS